jgi:hypothetical protein
MAANYNALHPNPSPYGTADPQYTESQSGFITPQSPAKKRTSNWIKFGIPALIIIIIAAVVGGVLGSRKSKESSSSSASGSKGSDAAASSAVSAKLAAGRFAVATDSQFMVPVYPSTVSVYHHHLPFCISHE